MDVSNIMDHSSESIIKELSTMYSVTKDIEDQEILRGPSNRLKTFFRRLDHLAALDLDDKSAEEILSAPEFDSAIESIVRFRNLYSLRLETENANAILDSEDPWGALKRFIHFSNYLQLALTEYQGSGLEPGDSIVFIGSGPLPLSLIMLCHQHGLRGIGIEQEPGRAKLSRRVLMQLGLSDKIDIIEGNHFGLHLNGCKLVMVAAAAEPKKEIFDHLAGMVPAGTKISYRIYEKGLRRLLETSSFLELPEQFEEYLRIRPKPPVNNTVVFLTKKDR